MNQELRSLASIDFLPQRYREAKIKRSAGAWRLGVAFALAGMLLSTLYFQQRNLWAAQRDLAKVDILHEAARTLASQLAEEQSKFPSIDQEAELLTYLRHRWPRTQILHAVSSAMPESVQMSSLNIDFELPELRGGENLQTGKEDPVDKNPSAARDLKRLREELDGGRWVVSVAGTSSDLAELHAYLNLLERQTLFSKVELVSIESPQSADQTDSRFHVRLVLRPGYGQPGGPIIEAQPEREEAA